MTGFTKGPWTSGIGTSTGMVVRANHEPKVRRNVASCGGMNREANAHLIAAAPDLYEALDRLVNWIWSEHGMTDRVNDAVKALSKARGEEK